MAVVFEQAVEASLDLPQLPTQTPPESFLGPQLISWKLLPESQEFQAAGRSANVTLMLQYIFPVKESNSQSKRHNRGEEESL